MAEKASAPSWIGPLAGALILVAGYVAYQQWHEHDQHEIRCASLKRAFLANGDSLVAGSSALDNAKDRAAILSPAITGPLTQSTALSSALDMECPGWIQKQYGS